MLSATSQIEAKLHLYKVRVLKNTIIKNTFVWATLFLGLLITGGLIEWVGQLSAFNRTLLAGTFILITLTSGILLILKPLLQILNINMAITDSDAAKKIGVFFPSVSDKLVNFLELSQYINSANPLIQASLNQKEKSFKSADFSAAINTQSKKRPLRFFVFLSIIIIVLLLFFPKDFISSTSRIIHFRKEYTPSAPFQFHINSSLFSYKNENYSLSVSLTGLSIPKEVFIIEDNSKIKLANAGSFFTTTFNKVQQKKKFHLEAAGYRSQNFELSVLSRPSMNLLYAHIRYPQYLQVENETISPVGELELPEGTQVTWHLSTEHTKEASFFYNEDTTSMKKEKNNSFIAKKGIFESGLYGFILASGKASQKGSIAYTINTIKDSPPAIQVRAFTDTLLYKQTIIGGKMSDDYGISNLRLIYQRENSKEQQIILPFYKKAKEQQIYINWEIDTLNFSPGEVLRFYLEVFDNDQVNGSKSSKSQLLFINFPDKNELRAQLSDAEDLETLTIDQTRKKSKELWKKLTETINTIKGKKELSWKDKQNIEALLKKKEALSKKIEELKKENNSLSLQRNKFYQPTEEMKEKNKELQRLIDELLDEETKELYKKLQELLEKKAQSKKVLPLLDEIKNKEINLEEELERTLELFKRLQVDMALDRLSKDLNDLSKKQNNLAQDSINSALNKEALESKQKEVEKQFNLLKENLNSIKKLNNKLKRPNPFEKTSEEEEAVDKTLSKIKKDIIENNKKNLQQHQKNASKGMKKFSQKISSMSGSMQAKQAVEDARSLRMILNNLITLSYSQEQTMKALKAVNHNNPEILTLSKQQLKLKDNSKIIKDSLLALSSRVSSISSFITRELNEMDTQLKKSITAIKERKKSHATAYQQLSMTSMNNLALMLDNVLQQMQKNMKKSLGKESGNQPELSMSKLQEQLNKEIKALQKSNKSGKELSKELAKLAAKQEKIRRLLRNFEKNLPPKEKNGAKQKKLSTLQMEMEKTELDLVNKSLSQSIQKRQKQILSRLLESEKATEEQSSEKERESTSASNYKKKVPKAFENYLKQKQKELELIKTVPPTLHPYYKKEVGKYFNRLKNN